MTYHHLNRFTAHAEATLTPAERLLAWHFSKEIRAKENYYSESLRRLALELDLDRRTLQKALASLVHLGLFERIDRTGTYAPIYRLLVACPENCFDLDQHNTKQELAALKTLVATNTPPLSDKNTAPYIDQREEEDFSSRIEFEEGSEELGFILKTLQEIKNLTEDHLTLKALSELHPRAITKAALKLTSKLDTAKRKKAYLAKIVLDTPQNLLEGAEAFLAGLEGSQRLQKDTETPEINLGNYTPAITLQRISEYATEKANFKPKSSLPWLNAYAHTGELNEFHLETALALEEVLEAARQWLPEKLQNRDLPIEIWLNQENEITIQGFLQGFGDLEHIQTAEELKLWETRKAGLERLRELWDLEHPNEKGSAKFWSEPEVIEFHQANPEPLTQEQKQERFFAYFNKALNTTAKTILATLPEPKEEETFSFWLEENFDLEEDLKEVLSYLPERSEGHEANLKKAIPAYLNALKVFTHSELIRLACDYRREKARPGSTYPLTASNWLEGLVKKYGYIERAF